MVSAVRVGGRRLHELAREGVEIERAARHVNVERFDVSAGSEPGVLRVDVTCSSGTYVRALAADLGRALGGGAHLRRLRRTAIGDFTLDEAHPLDDVAPGDVLPPEAALRGRPTVTPSPDVAARVGHGAVLDRAELGKPDGEGPWPVVDEDGHLLAVYEPHRDGRLKPAVVMARHD